MLAVADDATNDVLAVDVERVISGYRLKRMLDRPAQIQGLPGVLRNTNGKECCGEAILKWGQERDVQLRPIEPGKATQNACFAFCCDAASGYLGGAAVGIRLLVNAVALAA
jgi:putative transposase